MTVYVDNSFIRYRSMIMCHLMADTTAELLAMVDRIGVDRRWIQKIGTTREHFDISLAKRAKAIHCGAIEITARAMVRMIWIREGR